jgi:hypothetical protein
VSLITRLRALFPADPLLVCTVTAHNADGTSTVQFPGGQSARVRGQTVAVGLNAWLRGGRIEGEAPNLTFYSVDV